MSSKDLAALFSLAAVWGASFLFIRIASPEFGPFVTVELRVLIAALALLLYAAVIRYRFSFRAHWKKYLIVGTLNAAFPFVFITAAELHLTASLASIINATTPMFTALVAFFWFKTPLSLKKVAGMIMGIAGVAVLAGWGESSTGIIFVLSALCCVGAALFYGIASNYIMKNFQDAKPLDLAIGQQLGAGIVLIPFALFTLPEKLPSTEAFLSVIALAVVCTSMAYILFFYLINKTGALKTTSVTFLVPLFGVAWGVIFLDEIIHFNTIIGMFIILASIILVTDLRVKKGRTSERKTA
ncbi:drug/metabolite transporter (DMT)-like permease [Peribacillus deserti]|uniref:Drug/metabolite transporter (DMT)-like permease n=1 Tax=Peribacillus deserti TaxID=673318 RepID=A0ABS2QEB6_9BACI|nr:drug/metabolite transporter (DMT)-like permease [Peribacillus deserti]